MKMTIFYSVLLSCFKNGVFTIKISNEWNRGGLPSNVCYGDFVVAWVGIGVSPALCLNEDVLWWLLYEL